MMRTSTWTRVGAADALEVLVDEHAQDAVLGLARHVGDLVDVERAAMRLLERADPAAASRRRPSMPNSSASMFSGVIVAALMTTKGALARADSACRVRAASSLPEPGAPVMRMRALVGATRSIVWRSWFTAGEWPTIRLACTERARRSLTSRLRREASSARSATSTSRSALNGFSMKS